MFKLLLVLNGQKIFKTFLLFILILSIKRFYFILFNLFFWKALLFLNLIWVLPQIFKIELPYKRRFWLILVDRLFEIPQKLDLTFKSLLIFPSFLHIWRLLISLKQGPLVRNLFHNFSRRPVRIRFFQPLSLFLAVENVRWKGLFRSNSTWRVLHRFYVRHFHVRFHGRFITTWGHQRTILVFYWWLCFKLNSTLLVGFDWRFVHWDIISWAAFLRLIISHLVEHVNEFVHFFLVPFQILLSQLPILFQASFCLLLPDATNDFHNVQRSYLRLFFCYTGSSLQNKERKLDLNKKKQKCFSRTYLSNEEHVRGEGFFGNLIQKSVVSRVAQFCQFRSKSVLIPLGCLLVFLLLLFGQFLPLFGDHLDDFGDADPRIFLLNLNSLFVPEKHISALRLFKGHILGDVQFFANLGQVSAIYLHFFAWLKNGLKWVIQRGACLTFIFTIGK